MNDPFNQLPTDPDWLRRLNAIAAGASTELGGTVIMVVMQPEGKMCIACEGMPERGAIAQIYAEGGIPGILGSLAMTLIAMESYEKKRTPS